MEYACYEDENQSVCVPPAQVPTGMAYESVDVPPAATSSGRAPNYTPVAPADPVRTSAVIDENHPFAGMYDDAGGRCLTQASSPPGPLAAPVSYSSSDYDPAKTAWDTVTNNTVSTGFSLLDQANSAQRGAGAVDRTLVSMANKAPEALAQRPRLGNMSRVSGVLAPLGVISNGIGLSDAIEQNPHDAGGKLQRGLDIASNGAGLASSLISTASLLTSAEVVAAGGGAATAGAGAGAGTLAALGPVGAVLGSFAGGCAIGAGIEKYTGAGSKAGSLAWSLDKKLAGADNDPVANPSDNYKNTLAWKMNQWLE